MKNIDKINKALLFITAVISGYQVVTGGHGIYQITIWSYTIVGYGTFDKPLVIILSSLIPLSISNGLISQTSTTMTNWYLAFSISGFVIIIITRFINNKKLANFALALIHAISGLTILVLPIYLVLAQSFPKNLVFFSVGGLIMGIGGIVIFWSQKEENIANGNRKYHYLPFLLLLSTILFSVGLSSF